MMSEPGIYHSCLPECRDCKIQRLEAALHEAQAIGDFPAELRDRLLLKESAEAMQALVREKNIIILALQNALRPLAEQDCESWGCGHPAGGGPCEPKNARDLLAFSSELLEGEQRLKSFVLAILEHFGNDECMELDYCDFQDLATKFGIIRWEKYDPEKHGEDRDMDPGDPIWQPNVGAVKEDVCGPNSKDPSHWNCKCREGIGM